MIQTALQVFCILILSAILAACSGQLPTWRSRTVSFVEELGRNEAADLFPEEYRSLLDTYEHGEALYHVRKDDDGADRYYQLAFQKAEMLQSEVIRVKKERTAEKQRLIEELAAKADEERRVRAETELLEQAQQSALAVKSAPSAVKKSKIPITLQPTSYTVRRGETLPQISARSEIYNDSSLWPIIFRANRDQIRDPKRLWPGQVITIPRNFSRIDADEARRYSVRNEQK